MAGIELRSTAFNDHAPIPRRYARDGENVSPPLSWSGVPDDAAELLLLCEDPDAPTGTFVHWLVTGIPPADADLDAGQSPPGGRVRANGWGERSWGGPHPPAGDEAHRYFFRLYALPEPVSLPDDATADDVHRAVDAARLAGGTLVGTYQR
jgi:Raf kinase inhibitor-like YbhB/YbcL family protein